MKKIVYYLFIGLSILSSCKKGSDSSSTAVIPLQASLPDAFFTDLTKVSYAQTSSIIMDRLIAMIDAAPAGSTIHLCIYGFDHPGVINALKRASNRNVKLKFMIDLSREETILQNPPVISHLRSFLNSDSEMVVVTSDAGASSINHNKFVLFSELETKAGKIQNITFQTSHNFTVDDTKKIQDVVILTEKELYDAYLSYWNDMKLKAAGGMKDFYYREYINEGSGIQACFFPKRRNGSFYGADNIIEILDAITRPSSALIRIGMSDWTASRINILEKLNKLLSQGAAIEVIAKSKADTEILEGLEELRKKGAYVKIFNLSYSNQPKINIHSKFMLIQGEWNGSQRNILVTGSHNFTTNALRYNNETLLIFINRNQFFNIYMKAFDDMKTLPGLIK